MAATLTGIVFNDLNHNGQYNVGEPGIANVNVILFNQATLTCTPTTTDANGNYSFSIATAGSYTVYEPVANPGATCPPANFTQPAGFTVSNGPRKLTTTITAAQVNNGATISGQNFSHDANTNPLDCSLAMIQFAQQPTQWYNIDIVTGNSIIQGTLTPADNVNAIGYNILDNYIYGNDQTTHSIIRVDNSGNIMRLFPNPPGLPVQDYNTGTFDVSGFFYIYQFNDSRYYTIDLRPNSATFMKLVDPRNGYVEQTSNYGTPISIDLAIADWVFNTSDGFLYSLLATGQMRRINPTTGTVTNIATSPLFTGSFGAMAIDGTNTIYAISNNDGKVYRYTVSGNTATGAAFSNSVVTTANDGTMCPNAIIGVDFGDAPDTGLGTGPDNYNTLLSSNGPRHAQRTGLTLGTQITTELDAYQNPTATGDDVSKGVQDDGLTVPLATLNLSATTYSLDVTVTNETGESANLYGWVDFSQNGLFQGNEAAPVVVVPSAVGTQVVTLNFTKPIGVTLTAGHTFVRLRLTTDTLTNSNGPTLEDTRSIGPASDGEVEDYILTVTPSADLSVVKTTSPSPVPAGGQINYTIQVTNNGPDSAQTVSLADTIPPEILNPQYSLDGGVTYSPWVGSIPLGTMANGAISTVLIKGTVSATATGTTTNTATVSSPTEDPNPNNNSSTVNTPVSTLAELSIVKIASPSPVIAGNQLTYTLTINNAGPSDAQNVVLTDIIPANVIGAQFSVNGGVTFNPWVSPYIIGTVVDGETLEIIIQGVVASEMTESITNTAIVNSTTPDTNPDDNTSTVVTPVNTLADLSIIKTDSPSPVIAGNQITYTLNISNLGPSDAQAVSVADTLPLGVINAMFSVDGGVTFNPWISPYAIGTLPNGASETIIISGTVALDATDTLNNIATITSLTPDPDPDNNTSSTSTPVNALADIAVTKTASPNSVVAGEQVTYAIVTTNSGPSDAQNVIVTDVVPSVLLNPQYSTDGGVTFLPWGGSYVIGTLAKGALVTTLIRGIISPSAKTGDARNTVVVSSTTPDPDPTNNTSTTNPNVTTSADVSIVKSANPDPVTAGELLTYTIAVANSGPSDAQNVVLNDAIPSSFADMQYSTDGGITWNNWTGSYTIGTVLVGTTNTILIRGTTQGTTTTTIHNTASITSTTPDPDPNNNTSSVETLVNNVQITKASNVSNVVIGDTITYIIQITNKGQVIAENFIVTDPLTPDLAYADNLKLNGNQILGDITQGVNIGNVLPGQTVTLTFDATVLSTPNTLDRTIVNQTTGNYVYRANPAEPPIQGTAISNMNKVKVYSPSIQVTKIASAPSVIVGMPFVYTITVTNTGDITQDNVTVTDPLPAGFNVQSMSLGGMAITGDLSVGINIGTLAPGQAKVLEVTIIVDDTVAINHFNNVATARGEVTVDPNRPILIVTGIGTDENGIDIYNPKLVLTKRVDRTDAVVGSTVTYTITATNEGNVILNNVGLDNVLITDILSSELAFVPGSMTIDNLAVPNANILTGINLGSIAVNQTRIITFRATILSNEINPITNQALADFTYNVPGLPVQVGHTESSVVELNVFKAELVVTKTVDKQEANVGDTLTYTVTLKNTGDIIAYNVLFKDAISPQSTLIPGSFRLNGKVINGVDLSKGIVIGSIAPGQSVTITYQVRVTGSNCSGTIVNIAAATFEYRLPDGSSGTLTANNEAGSTIVLINISTFKQMSIESYLTLVEIKPNIEAINTVTGTIDIHSYHVITTPQGISKEGQMLTGYRLVIKGALNIVTEYTALDTAQSVHSASYQIPFSTFIVLPLDYVGGSKLEVTGLVEDIYYQVVDIRTFFANVIALINVKVMSCK